jgi:hypothetical protein
MVGVWLTSAGCESKNDGAVFIALDSDFAKFRTWERLSVGDAPLAGHPPGPRYVYLSQRAPKGASQYPVGTLVVKTIESDPDPSHWEVFAMTKRGGGFNARGAVNWEFFRLRMLADGTPLILTRGLFAYDPDIDGGISGYNGGLMADVTDLCNGCHGTPASAASDHLLSPGLRPGQ